MFSDPQFWVAISFMLFIAAIFNPVRKTLTSSLDAQIKDIKNRIDEVEKIKSEAQKTLDELKERESKVENEIDNLKIDCEKKISELEKISTLKLTEQIEKKKILTENKIDQLVRDTNISIKDYISSIAIKSARNFLLDNLNKDKKTDLIQESIKELNSVIKL